MMINKLTAVAVLVLPILVTISGCAPAARKAPVETKPPVETARCLPHDLTVDSLDNHYARIAWNPGCPETRILRGFNIYLSRKPSPENRNSRAKDMAIPYNETVYPGDAEGRADRESFEFRDLTLSTRYFARVRAVYDDSTFSPPTNEVEIIGYPQGAITLAESYFGRQDGFSFEKNDYCKTDAMENDLYYYSKDGRNFLCSPLRISRVNRKTEIFTTDKQGTLADLAHIEPRGKGLDKAEIFPGTILLIKTATGNRAALRIVKCVDAGVVRETTIQYYYLSPVK